MPLAGSAFVALLALASPQAPSLVPGTMNERIPCRTDPTQTYTLYLPKAYSPDRRWPLLFVFDPRGRGTRAAEVFRDAAEEFGWIIVSSDNTRSDGEWDPNDRALRALWPDTLRIYPIDERRIYAAGFSGGVKVAWVLSSSGKLAGIIAAGSPAPRDPDARPGSAAWFGSAGRFDFNFLDAREIDDRMARFGVVHRLEFFDGPHQWMTPEVARLGVAWLEVLAMKDGTRPRDAALAGRLLAEDLKYVARLEASGRIVDARRSLQTIVGTYATLADASAAERRARELDQDARLARARKDEQRKDERERSLTRSAAAALATITGDEEPFARDLIEKARIPTILRTARQPGYEGESAQRALETIFVQASFYMPEALEQQRRFSRAAVALEIASAIHPDRPFVWLNLAGARAMAGFKKPALEALEKAIELGFRDADTLTRDERFVSLRTTPEYVRLMAALGGK